MSDHDTDREITAKINTSEVLKAWEERVEKAREVSVDIALGARTDLGRVRENNEDKFEFFIPTDEDTLVLKGSFFAVADGMGGHSAGQIASELALKTAIRSYYADNTPNIEYSIRTAVQEANAIVFEAARAIAERSGMGTTVTALVIRGEEVFVAQVGDSRCYRLRGRDLRRLTEDHSWVNEQVRLGTMSEQDAVTSPFRNVITRCIGNAPGVDSDVIVDELREGDVYLLCSDGLTGELTDEQIRDKLLIAAPSRAAWELVDLALENGGRDNVTALVVAIREIARRNKKRGLGSLLGRG